MEGNIAYVSSKNNKVQELLDAGLLFVEVKYKGQDTNMPKGNGDVTEIIEPGNAFRVLIKVVLTNEALETFTTSKGSTLQVEDNTGSLNDAFELDFQFNFKQATNNDA
jgi:hypothetical protein